MSICDSSNSQPNYVRLTGNHKNNLTSDPTALVPFSSETYVIFLFSPWAKYDFDVGREQKKGVTCLKATYFVNATSWLNYSQSFREAFDDQISTGNKM